MAMRTGVCAMGLVCGALWCGVSAAGPITPPPGPVVGTPGPEPRIAISAANTPGDTDASPSVFKITSPGSYYLTGNVTGVAGKHGIEIVTSGVTLDLNGFDLVGVAGMGAFDGVSVTVDSLRNITVLNGSVRNWGDGGVDLGFLSRGCRVEGVGASGNAGTGITSSISSTVTNCTSSFNGQRGIRASNGSTLSHCSVESNTGSGIEVNHGCTISNCSAYFNGVGGILTGLGCTVVDCSAYQNTGHGLQLGESGSASRCSTVSNTGNGIIVSHGSTVTDCTATSNGADGIRGSIGVTIAGCAARSNTLFGIVGGSNAVVRGCTSTANGRTGIHTNQGVVSNCTSSHNDEDGITVLQASTVIDCTTYSNSLSGIECGPGNLIRNNTCNLNGEGAGDGAGITVLSGADNHIEGNNCTAADRGIDVRVAGNTIIGNTCSGNSTDWVIVAGNSFGPILDRRASGGAPVNGFSAATNLNTTDPHANFSY